MKNSILIDLDTERTQQLLIGKPPEIAQPANPEEAKEMINMDILCVCEALCTLIHIADQNNYGKKDALVNMSIEHLTDMLKKD